MRKITASYPHHWRKVFAHTRFPSQPGLVLNVGLDIGGCFLSRKRNAAFSLVEVVLALGIVGFSLLTVLGLLPVGLQSLRMSVDQTTKAQIVQRITGELLLSPFDTLKTEYDDKTFYFNEYGERVGGVGEGATANALYKVKTTLTQVNYPGSSRASTNVESSLKAIRVEFENINGGRALDNSIILVPFSDG